MGCINPQEKTPAMPLPEVKKALEQINKDLVEIDREKIEAYIERHQLEEVKQNESGLYYLVWGQPTGNKVKKGNTVVFNYSVSLLDGTLCYKSEGGKPKEFVVGYGGVESGLEMAMLLMYQGQKGKFILPPHLAHGLLGDNDKIPPRSVIVYDVHLLLIIDN